MKFEIIFSNQVMYYLPNETLKSAIQELNDMANEGGIFFATMISSKNYYYKHIKQAFDGGLSEVTINERINSTQFASFIKDTNELIEIFKPFKYYMLVNMMVLIFLILKVLRTIIFISVKNDLA